MTDPGDFDSHLTMVGEKTDVRRIGRFGIGRLARRRFLASADARHNYAKAAQASALALGRPVPTASEANP